MKKHFLWIIITGFLFLITLTIFVFLEYRLHATFNETRNRLKLLASKSVLSISADDIFNVPLEQRSEGTPAYLNVYRKLVNIKAANLTTIKYIYIMTTTGQPGILQYVVDADPVPQIITAHCATSLPGDKFDAHQFPEMLKAFNGTCADKKITTDVWGTFLSGYAPIRDNTGNSVAILGVDTDAASLQLMERNVKTSGIVVLFTGFLFFISLVVLLRP